MPAHRTGSMVLSGSWAECLSAPVLGTTGAGGTAAITVAQDTTGTVTMAAATTGADMLGAMLAAVTDEAMPVTMLAAATATLTAVAADSMAAVQSAAPVV